MVTFQRQQSRLNAEDYDLPANKSQLDAAALALMADSGCLETRAKLLVEIYADIAAQEAVEIVAGNADVSSGVLDLRVARLRRIVEALPDSEDFPNDYELGAIFKITASQARSVIRTYAARNPAAYRDRLAASAKRATASAKKIGDREVWVIEFSDPETLDFARDALLRRGLSKGLVRDLGALTLTVPRDARDREGNDAITVLGCKKK